MAMLQVDTLSFNFNATVAAQIYDQWQHYLTVWNAAPGGQKAVDVVAVESAAPPASTVWLIEAKDFRVITNPPKASNISGLPQFVADKAAHTLAGLAHASANAAVAGERQLATAAAASTTRRIVLHLEPHLGAHTALFPVNFSVNVYQALKALVAHIDPKPLVLNIANTAQAGVPWSVS